MSSLKALIGAGQIKAIQRGTISVLGGSISGTATISSVTTGKAELRFLGASGITGADTAFRIELTSSTVITATRGTTTGNTIVSWELTEWS